MRNPACVALERVRFSRISRIPRHRIVDSIRRFASFDSASRSPLVSALAQTLQRDSLCFVVCLASTSAEALFTRAAIATQDAEKSTGNRMFWIVAIGSVHIGFNNIIALFLPGCLLPGFPTLWTQTS